MNWKILLALATVFLISGCSILKPETQIITQTEYVQRNIPIQAAPKPLTLNEVKWYVVTEENFPEFLETYKKENGEPWVFYGISVRSYESMALNLAELRRYIEQQQAIILYYEEQVEAELETPVDKDPEQ